MAQRILPSIVDPLFFPSEFPASPKGLPLLPLLNLQAMLWINCTRGPDPGYDPSTKQRGDCMVHYWAYHELHRRRRAAYPFGNLMDDPFHPYPPIG